MTNNKQISKPKLELFVNKKQNTLLDNTGYSSNIHCVFGLPTRKIDDIVWRKENNLYKFVIINENYEIPYGCYARMNQIFIDTEIILKKTNQINLGNTFTEYTRKLGYQKGKATRLLYKQLINYVTSNITIHYKGEKNRLIGQQMPVGSKWDIYFDIKNPDSNLLFDSEIKLNDDYVNYVLKHAVPLDLNFIKVIKNNTLALDFYQLLAYRNNNLKKELQIKAIDLISQLGNTDKQLRRVRTNLKHILKLIQQYWAVDAKFEEGYFILKPSPPAVQKKIKY